MRVTNVETGSWASCDSRCSDARPGCRRVPAVRVERAERGDVRDDDDVPRRARERTTLRIDDRAARADQVDGAVRLPVRERGVRGAVKNLDRPGSEREEAERDPDDGRQAADADEEAGAAEEGRVCARVRL